MLKISLIPYNLNIITNLLYPNTYMYVCLHVSVTIFQNNSTSYSRWNNAPPKYVYDLVPRTHKFLNILKQGEIRFSERN